MTDQEKMFNLIQDSPAWKWFPNNAEMLKLADHLLSHGVTIREQGEWVQKGAWHIECSECHYILAHVCEAKNYCPYCGAPMKGESNVH